MKLKINRLEIDGIFAWGTGTIEKNHEIEN